MKILLFNEELRECLNAAGFSDCGENDSWNYWYQRIMKAFNESVDRQIITEQSENAKLRELVRDWREFAVGGADSLTDWNHQEAELEQRMRELGVDE